LLLLLFLRSDSSALRSCEIPQRTLLLPHGQAGTQVAATLQGIDVHCARQVLEYERPQAEPARELCQRGRDEVIGRLRRLQPGLVFTLLQPRRTTMRPSGSAASTIRACQAAAGGRHADE
jgi:hypothetical protein